MKTVCIILNYNDPDTTEALVRRIRDFACLDAVLIVDNASTDGSRLRLLRLVSGRVILISSETNGGYGAGNNLGLKYAREILKARYALIANPDVEFTEECVEALVRTMEADPRIGIAAPVQINAEQEGAGASDLNPGDKSRTLTGPAAWPIRPWFYDLLESGPVCRRIFRPLLHYPESRYRKRIRGLEDGAVRVDCVPGSLLLVDTEKMAEAGGYDENVFLYEEEYILGFRMREAGHRTVLLTGEHYLHRHGASIKKSTSGLLSRQKLREESTRYYFRTYLGAGKAAMCFTEIFFAAVRTEIRLLGRFASC